MMTTIISYTFNKGLLINTPPLFDGKMFELWKARMEFFVEANDLKCGILLSMVSLFLLIILIIK